MSLLSCFQWFTDGNSELARLSWFTDALRSPVPPSSLHHKYEAEIQQAHAVKAIVEALKIG